MRRDRALRVLLAIFLLALAGCFPREPGPRLRHFPEVAPPTGAIAPDFALRTVDGEEASLSSLLGTRPIVLQLGSHSCPVFRYRQGDMAELMEEFAGRVHFVVVYSIEAHPAGSRSPYADREWRTLVNRLTGVAVPQPTTDEERVEQARRSVRRLELDQLVLVDTLENAVWETYGRASSPAFVIDREGRIVLRQPWVAPAEIRRTLTHLLAEEAEGTEELKVSPMARDRDG